MVDLTDLVFVPIDGRSLVEVIRRTGEVSTVVGYIRYQPWEPRGYVVHTADGRIVKAGMGKDAAKDWASLRTDWR
jgi:hypothetical protein